MAQSALTKGHQILYDSLMLKEIVEWYKLNRLKLIVYKDDFKNAYDFCLVSTCIAVAGLSGNEG